MRKQIRDYVNKLLFEIDVPDLLEDVWVDRYVVGSAIKDKVNLKAAVLTDMNLRGVDFSEVELVAANFSCSDLSGALFVDANCADADFSYANLDGASFEKANAEGAYFNEASLEGVITRGTCLIRAKVKGEANLIGSRPIFQLGPIGYKEEYLVALVTDRGLRIKTKTFEGDFEEYVEQINSTVGQSSPLYPEFQAAFELIKSHALTWHPSRDDKGVQLSLQLLRAG